MGQTLTEAEWREKDLRFERVMRRKGYIIKPMGEDGACLFRYKNNPKLLSFYQHQPSKMNNFIELQGCC